MSKTVIHELKLRIWKQPAKKRPQYMSDLETAAQMAPGTEQDTALAEIAKSLDRADALSVRRAKRKEAELKAAEDKLRQDIGL